LRFEVPVMVTMKPPYGRWRRVLWQKCTAKFLISARLHGITLQQRVIIMKYNIRQSLTGQSVTIANYCFIVQFCV